MLPLFFAFFTAMAAALVMVPFLRRWALDRGTVDLPGERRVHEVPTPRLGGIAIFLAFLFAAVIFAPPAPFFRGLVAGTLVIFAIGIADDLQGLPSRSKFAGQIIGSLVAIAVSGLWLADLGDPFGFGRIVLPTWAGVSFTVFALVGVTNAINLIDGLDGLAGGVSVLALAALTVLGVIDGDSLVPVLAVALAGAILGFLKYNFYPARIFMGDTGSLTVGFVLGFLAVHLTQRPGGAVSPMLPVLILGLPLFDAIWVMCRRLLRHASPFAADKTHVHHRFLNLGFAHRFTVLIIYTLTCFWCCSALLLRSWPDVLLLAYLLGTAGSGYLLLRHVSVNRERYPVMQWDADRELRLSALFERYAAAADRLMPLLGLLLGLYAVLAVGSPFLGGRPGWPVALLVLLGGIVLGRERSGKDGEFLLLLVYAAACLAAFSVWQAERPVLAGLSAKRCGDALLLLASLAAAVKLGLRRPGEFFLSSADFLALALMIFLVIASRQPTLALSYGGPLLRSIVLVLAIRTLAMGGPAVRRRLVDGALLLLGGLTVAGWLTA